MRTIQESEYARDVTQTEEWKIFKWVWDKLDVCPDVKSVADVDFHIGEMGLISNDGDEYTITIKKRKWREI